MALDRHRMRLPLAALVGALLCSGAATASAQARAAAPSCPRTGGRDLPAGSLDARDLAIDPFVGMFNSFDVSKLDVRSFLLLSQLWRLLQTRR